MLFPLPRKTKNNSIVFIKSLNLTKNVDPYKVHLFGTYRYWLMGIFVKIWVSNKFATIFHNSQ